MSPITRTETQSFWRILRQVIDTGLPLLGVSIILGAVLFLETLHARVVVVVLGLLLIEMGVWKLAHQLLPNERQFHTLRTEGERFLLLIRHLNDAALALQDNDDPENRQAFAEIREMMHQSVEHMAEVAGKTDAELATRHEASI